MPATRPLRTRPPSALVRRRLSTGRPGRHVHPVTTRVGRWWAAQSRPAFNKPAAIRAGDDVANRRQYVLPSTGNAAAGSDLAEHSVTAARRAPGLAFCPVLGPEEASEDGLAAQRGHPRRNWFSWMAAVLMPCARAPVQQLGEWAARRGSSAARQQNAGLPGHCHLPSTVRNGFRLSRTAATHPARSPNGV